MKPIYVIGHKNPDIDSVAAAIGYKVYKQSFDQGLYIAACAGDIKEEIDFILKKMNFDQPVLIKNVGNTVEDLLDDKENIYITTDMSLAELSNFMRKYQLKTVPVLDERERFLGLLTIGDLAMIFMENLGSGRNVENSPVVLRKIMDQKVSDIMKTRDLMLFERDEPVAEVRKHMLETRFRNYPVVDEQNRFLGMISRYNLLEAKRKKVILVDHNERKQAVDGIEEAEILEIIDHHRVGDLQTISPILFHNEPVGSTSTLVAEMFIRYRIYMSADLAGLLLAGILSDTMIFKSPTTTKKDRNIAVEMQQLCGLDPVEWGKTIFENSMQSEDKSEEELIIEDLKEYSSRGVVFAISQIETIDSGRTNKRKDRLYQAMEELCQRRGYAFMCLMITDILEEGTELIIAGEKKPTVEQFMGEAGPQGGVYLQGVLSRKKQVVPLIYEALRKENLV